MAKYTKHGRLADVITLISFLALDKSTSHTNQMIIDGVRSDSKKDWLGIARSHPEFFRTNLEGDHIALLLRSNLEYDERYYPGFDTRKPLSLEQTQKVIESAISLHDKEIGRSQRFGYIITAFIAAIVSIGTTLLAINLKSGK